MKLILYIFCLFSVSVFSNDQELSHLWKSGYDSELIAYFEKNPDQLKEPRDLSKNLASSITRARHELFLWLLSKTEKVDKDVVRSALYKTKYLEKVLQKADKDVVNEAFESALNYQSLNFSIDALSMLVAKGADVNKAFKNKQYPIHMATLMGSGYLKVLVDAGADVNVKGPYENTPLHDAASRGKFHSFLYLLKNGADPEIKTKSGKTVKEAFSGYARNLVKHYFETGETPADYWMLKLAIDENDELALREVLSRKKELINFKFAYPVINQKNVEISVVKYAQDARKDTALKILLEYGAPHDEGKENAMFHLATLGDVDTLEKILKVKPVDTLDKNGTPLWFYARNLETFKLLFVDKHGFDYRDKLNRGAIFGRNYYDDSFFRYLVENIKDKNKVDYDGKNTYHYLAKGRNLELLEKALSEDSDIHWADFEGHTPVAIALENRWFEGVEKFMAAGSAVPKTVTNYKLIDFIKDRIEEKEQPKYIELLKKYSSNKREFRGVIGTAVNVQTSDFRLAVGGRKIVGIGRKGFEIADPFSNTHKLLPLNKASIFKIIHPNTTIAVLNHKNGYVPLIWDLKSGRQTGEIKTEQGNDIINSDFCKDGLLAYGNRKYFIYRLPGGALKSEFEIKDKDSVYFSEDFTTSAGNSIIVLWRGSTLKIYDYSRNVTLWDTQFENNIRRAELSPNGEKLFVSFHATDQLTQIIEMTTKKVMENINGLESQLFFNPNGRFVTYMHEGRVKVFIIKNWKQILDFPMKGKLLDVAPDNTVMLIYHDYKNSILKVPKDWFSLN